MDARPIGCFYRNCTTRFWQGMLDRWMLTPSDAGTGRDQVGSVGTRRYRVGSDGCSPHRMLLGTGLYQVGRDGCSQKKPDVIRLAAMDARPHRWQGWMLAPSEASRNQTVPGWQTCSPHPMLLETGRYKRVGRHGCSPHRMLRGTSTLAGWQGRILAPSDASRNRTLPGGQRWMLAGMDARPIGC